MAKRVATLIMVLVAAGAVSTAALGGTGNAGKVRVLCWNKTFPGTGEDPQIRTEPRRCSFFKRGAVSNAEGSVHTTGLKWSRWGQHRAKARGTQHISTAPSVRVRIHLSRPVERCGRTVFSKLTWKRGGSKNDFKLYTC